LDAGLEWEPSYFSTLPSVKLHDCFFEKRRNCARDLGHSTIQKVNTTLCMMAYGIPTDLVNVHLAMGECQAIKCGKCKGGKTESSVFLTRTMTFEILMCTTIFKRISLMSGGHGLANKTTSSMLYMTNSMLYVINFECICVDLCAT
jgi:hypothetical protein